jgi:hypothetical protein
LPTESGWEMHQYPLDADIEALPARVSVLRDYQAAAHQEWAAQTFAGTSAPAAMPPIGAGEAGKFYEALPATTIPVQRIHYLARRIHLLGERPLAELFIELAAGGDFHGVLERYARLAPAADFIRALGGDRLPAPRAVSGGRR